MSAIGQHTLHEIETQPDAWAAALETLHVQAGALRAFFSAGRYSSVLFTGCGSSYYLALSAAAVWQDLTGLPARGVPASEVWLYPYLITNANQRALLIAVSRSGETTEVLRACDTFMAMGRGDVLTMTCYPDSALTAKGTFNIVLPSAQEESVAQTRAFTTQYLIATALAMLWADRHDLLAELALLPEAARHLLVEYRALAETWGNDARIERYYFLGSGARYGLACELSLKMKEMSLSHSEPFHFLEFRHGPQSMVSASTLLVGLVSGINRKLEMDVLDEMRPRGAHILAIGDAEANIGLPSGMNEIVRNVLCLPVGQLVAFYRSLSRGLNPDRPHNLEAVVKLK